jgi:RNA chaperone Hfq
MKMQDAIEETFISELINAKTPVRIYLKNGICLKGIIVGSDKSVLFLQHDSFQMVFKHRISTIAPSSY